MGSHVEVSVEGFYKSLDRLVVQDAKNSGDGRVYGTEWLIRWQKDPKMFGMARLHADAERAPRSRRMLLRLFEYDQTHILTAILSRALPNGWRIGGRFRLVSGNLYTPNNPGRARCRSCCVHARSARSRSTARGSEPSTSSTSASTSRRTPSRSRSPPTSTSKTPTFTGPKKAFPTTFNYTQQEPVLGLPILPILGLRGDL